MHVMYEWRQCRPTLLRFRLNELHPAVSSPCTPPEGRQLFSCKRVCHVLEFQLVVCQVKSRPASRGGS